MDVYRIGVSIIANNGVSPVLTTIAGQMRGINALTSTIGSGIGGWGAALVAVGGVLAAGAIVKGLVEIAKAGGEVNHQLELMKTAGMSAAEIQSSMNQAVKTSGTVLTTNLAENLQHIRELRYAFGQTTTAIEHLDEISKSNMILNNIRGGKGKDEVWELVKSLESKGVTYDPKEFSSYVDTMTKVVQATGGKVTPQQFFSTFKYGRTSTLGWDQEFITGALPRLIQEYSGGGGSGTGGPGNALMSAYAKIVQGQMSKTGAHAFAEMGLGHDIAIKGSASARLVGMPGRDLFMKNPYEWVQQVLMPALQAKGVTSQEDILAKLSEMFQVRTASDIMAKMALQGRFREGMQSPFEKDIALQKQPMGLPGYDELIKNDYPTILKAFHEQFTNLLQTLGAPLMAPGGPVIRAMAAMVEGLGALGQFAGRNMETIKAVANVIGDIGSIVGKIDSAALQGLSMVLPQFRMLGDIPWAAIHQGLNDFTGVLSALTDRISVIVDRIKGFFGGSGKVDEQFKKDLDNANKSYLPMNFVPSKDNVLKAQPINLNLNVDGRTLAQVVTDQLQYLYEHPTGAPGANRLGSWSGGDSNYTGI